MLSSNPQKLIQASQRLVKLCRDVSHTNSIKDVYDILLRWVAIKLYGGNCANVGVFDVVGNVLSVL